MKTQFYLVEEIPGIGEFNIFQGTKDECENQKREMNAKGNNNLYVSSNRWN